MFFIPTNSQHKQEAWVFLEHLVSPEPMRDFTIALANLPARKSLLEDPAYGEITGFSYWLESLKSPNLRTFTTAPWAPEYRTEIASALDEIANLNKSPEDGMAEVEEKAKELAE
jgi:multiple sugar transport system substrate-binding protein